MAKEYYDVSYKTYFNDRLKKVILKGEESYPLYIRMTFDRETTFFKSYYFNFFAQPKYDFLQTPISQIVELENRVIDSLIERRENDFSLQIFAKQYKICSVDILDSFDGSFKIWLATYLKKEGLPGLAAMIESAGKEVPAIRIWDDLKKILLPDAFARMEENAGRFAPPYIPLVAYVRHKSPEGPFCLPVNDWLIEANRIEIETFIDSIFWRVDFDFYLQEVRRILYPGGIS